MEFIPMNTWELHKNPIPKTLAITKATPSSATRESRQTPSSSPSLPTSWDWRGGPRKHCDCNGFGNFTVATNCETWLVWERIFVVLWQLTFLFYSDKLLLFIGYENQWMKGVFCYENQLSNWRLYGALCGEGVEREDNFQLMKNVLSFQSENGTMAVLWQWTREPRLKMQSCSAFPSIRWMLDITSIWMFWGCGKIERT